MTSATAPQAPPLASSPAPAEGAVGLALHMADARVFHDRALLADLLDSAGVELVHDLRVAIRRCRSLAQGLAKVDIAASGLWRQVSTVGRPLFAGLGALRDAQVMREWFERLLTDDTQVAALASVDATIAACVVQAREAIAAFDVEAWEALRTLAPPRAEEMLRHRPALLWLGLVRWQEARTLHIVAMRRRTPESLHEVRIGLKRLRYTLESLLPELHREVHKPLKKVQDLLGDIHDLDVAMAAVAGLGEAAVAPIAAARAERLAAYKTMATGRSSVWNTLRGVLPRRPDAMERCRRAYVLEVADALGVDGRHARLAERTARAVAESLGVTLDAPTKLAVLLAPAKTRRARRAARGLLGMGDDERVAVRRALRDDPVVRAVRAAVDRKR